jgi:hypothetical protein
MRQKTFALYWIRDRTWKKTEEEEEEEEEGGRRAEDLYARCP